MPISDREWSGLVRRVDNHGDRIRLLELDDADAKGAAREGARASAKLVAAVSVVCLFAQTALSLYLGGHGG